MTVENDGIKRCDWANTGELEKNYHDMEWGRPLHDERKLFELLLLEGQQAGLSWSTILKKRETMREAFDQFNPSVIMTYGEKKTAELMNNPGIIRNRLKIKSVIENSKAYFKLVEKHTSLDHFLWSTIDYQPIKNHWSAPSEVPCSTPLSEKISADLKKLGFKFVGPTITYALMQSTGMVNDHLTSCYLYNQY